MTYYFSTSDGDDSRTAFQAQSSATPWQTLTKLNSFFSSLLPGDQVLFKKGDIFYGSIVCNKSGTSGSPISFGAYGSGVNPIITGMQEVTAWTSLGGDQWQSTSAVSTLSTLNMVTVNDSLTPLGRWPNGTFNYEPVVSHTGSDNQQGLAASITGTSFPFDFTGGEVVIRKRHWIIDRAIITSHVSNTLNFLNSSIYAATDGFGFFVQNHQNACDQDDEWWYDSATKKIGIFKTVTPTGVQVANVEILFNIGSQSYLNVTDIDFKGSNSAHVNVTSGHHLTFSACYFSFAGINGFTVSTAAHHISIISCFGIDTNNNFIEGGSSQNWVITSTAIVNTAQIPGMGQSRDGNYIGIHNVGSNSLVQYCSIINTGYIGIEFKGDNVKILNNFVNIFCNVKDDGGGIYTYTGPSTTTYTFRTVDGNIVFNGGGASDGTNTSHEDAFGIYMDDNASQVTISNNTVFHCGAAGIFLHAAHDIKVLNNTLYDNAQTTGAQFVEVYPGATTTGPVRNLVVTGNKIVSKDSTQRIASLKTSEGNMSQWPLGLTNANYNDNHYARPINEDATTFEVIRSSGTTVTDLPGWVGLSGASLDGSSNISPVTIGDIDQILFQYNNSNSPLTISLGASGYVDAAGFGYTGDVVLPPWSSLVLFLTDEPLPDPPPDADPINNITINFIPCDPMPVEGYDIVYRVVGDPDYIDAGFFTSSPAVIPVDYPAGTHFEGLLKTDCGDVPWSV